MIGKHDLCEIVEQVRCLEAKMAADYNRLADAVCDPLMHDILANMARDERNHCLAVEDIMSLIKYG